jgi:hypothetical protein
MSKGWLKDVGLALSINILGGIIVTWLFPKLPQWLSQVRNEVFISIVFFSILVVLLRQRKGNYCHLFDKKNLRCSLGIIHVYENPLVVYYSLICNHFFYQPDMVCHSQCNHRASSVLPLVGGTTMDIFHIHSSYPK